MSLLMRSALLALVLALPMRIAAAPEASDPAPAGAVQAEVDESALSQHMRRIAAQLRCLVCQGENVADSQADLAKDMRRKIREQLEMGWSDERIFDYFVARYGDFVLYRPPVRRATWLLWFGPGMLLVLGLASLFLILRSRARATQRAALSAAELERAQAL